MILAARRRQNPQARGPRYVAQASGFRGRLAAGMARRTNS